MGESVHDIEFCNNSLDVTPQNKGNRIKNWTSSKLKILCIHEYYEQKQPTEWVKIYANLIPDKGLYLKYIKNSTTKQ